MAETYDLTLPLLAKLSKLPNSVFWRQNSGMLRSMDGARIVRAASINGLPDILGVVNGFPVAVETKTARRRQSDSQRRFQSAFEQAGGVYIVARDIETALAQVAAL